MSEDDTIKKITGLHVLGQDISMLSVEEIAVRIQALSEEMIRLEAERVRKEKSKQAAAAFFSHPVTRL